LKLGKCEPIPAGAGDRHFVLSGSIAAGARWERWKMPSLRELALIRIDPGRDMLRRSMTFLCIFNRLVLILGAGAL